MKDSQIKLRVVRNTGRPEPRENPDSDWATIYDRVLAMPAADVERLERTLLSLRGRAGVTVPQMELLRAIHARRTAPGFSRPA